jgi:hypothetical protein
MTGRQVLFEFTVIGDVARCAAVDAETGFEVVAVGPAHGPRAALENLALRKLERAMAGQEPPEEPGPPPRPGKLA